jgi:poly-gamma-glutamate synthesis protein (capsule biosynthesis protein)
MKNKIYFLFPVLVILSVIAGFLLISPNLNQNDKGSEINTDLNNNKNVSTLRTDAVSTSAPSPTPTPYLDIKGNSPDNQKVVLSFMGDVLLDSHVSTLIDQFGTSHILSDVKQVISSSDISMANFESPISDRGTKENNKQYTFRTKPQNVKVLTDGGINMLSLANNHIFDYGEDAFIDTLKHLKANNIRYAGAGENADGAYSPVYFNKNGVSTAILASSHVIPFVTWHPGTKKSGVSSTYDPVRLLAEIEKAKSNADIVVVYVHWGEEMNPVPVNYQKNLARMYIDKGADVVIGSHPHVLQGIEFYNGRIIAYSLGNFIFTNQTMESMILNIEVKQKEISKVQVIPSRIENFRPILIKDELESQEFYKKLNNISFGVEIDSTGTVKPK